MRPKLAPSPARWVLVLGLASGWPAASLHVISPRRFGEAGPEVPTFFIKTYDENKSNIVYNCDPEHSWGLTLAAVQHHPARTYDEDAATFSIWCLPWEDGGESRFLSLPVRKRSKPYLFWGLTVAPYYSSWSPAMRAREDFLFTTFDLREGQASNTDAAMPGVTFPPMGRATRSVRNWNEWKYFLTFYGPPELGTNINSTVRGDLQRSFARVDQEGVELEFCADRGSCGNMSRYTELLDTAFALVPAGHGRWSHQFTDVVEACAIPVVMSDGLELPYSELIDWSQYAILLKEDVAALVQSRPIATATVEERRRQQLLTWMRHPEKLLAQLPRDPAVITAARRRICELAPRYFGAPRVRFDSLLRAAAVRARLPGSQKFLAPARPPLPYDASGNPDWVEGVLRNRAHWGPVVDRCAGGGAADEEAYIMSARRNMSDAGLEDEYSDLPEWAADQLEGEELECSADCFVLAAPPNITVAFEEKVQAEMLLGADEGLSDLRPTTGKCIKTYGSRLEDTYTCEFRNLYTVMGGFVAHIVEGDDFPDPNLRVRPAGWWHSTALFSLISVVKHPSRQHLRAALAGEVSSTYPGTTLAFTPKWIFNVGHALYDSLYPAFVSLVQWGRHERNFRVMLLGLLDKVDRHIENLVPGAVEKDQHILGLIGGLGTIRQTDLKVHQKKLTPGRGISNTTWFRRHTDLGHVAFEVVVLGTGFNGQKLDANANFSLGAGRGLDAARLFRNRMYQSLKIKPRKRQPDRKQLKGIIIHNRRWGDTQPEWAEPLIWAARLRGVDLEYVHWGQARKGRTSHNTAPSEDTFLDQMKLFSEVDIHISSPGTAQMYQQFLPDGAVHVNLASSPYPVVPPMKYMEEWMSEGAPYIKTLYYWPDQRSDVYDSVRLLELIEEARDLIKSNFPIPVPVNSNLSPLLKVVKAYAYLTQNATLLEDMTPLCFMRPVRKTYAMDRLGNSFPHEHMNRGRMHGSFNQCLLKELLADYGEPCPGCFWGF